MRGIFLNSYGDFGGGSSEEKSSSESSSETSNLYTEEQKNYLKNLLSGTQGVSSSLMQQLSSVLNSAASGTPTEAEKAYTSQEKRGIESSYKDAGTQAAESLASRGMEDSGVSNKVMKSLLTEKSKALQQADVDSLQRQQDALWEAISKSLGLSTVAASLSTAAQGQTGKSTEESNTQKSVWQLMFGL